MSSVLTWLTRPVVKQIMSIAVLSIDTLIITNPQETSFGVEIDAKITNTGPFDSKVSFGKGLVISWKGQALGTLRMDNIVVNAVAYEGGRIQAQTTLDLVDVKLFTDFTKMLIDEESFPLEVSGKDLTVSAYGFQFQEITLPTKVAIVKGFNGLRNCITINSFDSPADDLVGGIQLTTQSTLMNPSQVGIKLSSLAFDIYVSGIKIASVSSSSSSVALAPQSTSPLPLAGELVLQDTARGSAAVSAILDNFIRGKDSSVTVHGASANLGNATWLNEGIRTLRIMTSLPNRGKLNIVRSPDTTIDSLHRQYIDAKRTIRGIVTQIIRPLPRVLIDTVTGHLCDKEQQAEAFERLPAYSELVLSSMIQLDYVRIWREAKEFYQYVMLSHKWESGEPLLQDVQNTPVYNLRASSANIKLRKFCLLARSLGFRWAWSDTCCVDKSSNVVLQESLVAMFAWYRGSSLTLVYLRDVSSGSRSRGALQGSIWNTRAWTYQEYIAAEVVRFYTGDWKPYLGLTLHNHKDSPDIISEMQSAARVSAQEIGVLQPGLDKVREKLYLASRRVASLVEDIAYSLFGIFNLAIPVIYGEGDRAVGRLLEHILNGSRDVTVLAWTGSAGKYNSCLPMDLTVYSQLTAPHIPLPMETVEMENTIIRLRAFLPDLLPVTRLYNQLRKLPPPSLTASRLNLPGIIFPLVDLRLSESDSRTKIRTYRATTSMLRDIEIKTADDLTRMEGLCLVHPWIRPLLSQESPNNRATLDETTQALRFMARLTQPFGALLFAQWSPFERRRVATDALVMVQIREEVSLTELDAGIHTIEAS